MNGSETGTLHLEKMSQESRFVGFFLSRILLQTTTEEGVCESTVSPVFRSTVLIRAREMASS